MDNLVDGSVTRLANPSLYIPLPEVIRIAKDILRGLEYLHTNNFFHNDIKPENVLIGPQGRGMLTDYGIVSITQNGKSAAPPDYYKIHVAPETRLQNETTAQTDIYQTGLTLFRMLVGLDTLREKFTELGEQGYYNLVAQADLVCSEGFPAYVPLRIRKMILKAVNPNPEKRFSSALEMRRELEKLNYPGFWTVKANGDFVGEDSKCMYHYSQTKKANSRFDVEAKRRNKKSGRETRCQRYCHSNVANSDAKKKIDAFIKAVVKGI